MILKPSKKHLNNMEYPVTIKNVAFCKTTRENYKYVVARECYNGNDELEYWFFDFTNDLYTASMQCRETGNGVVFELSNCVDETGE